MNANQFFKKFQRLKSEKSSREVYQTGPNTLPRVFAQQIRVKVSLIPQN